jgi:hypothetical protein
MIFAEGRKSFNFMYNCNHNLCWFKFYTMKNVFLFVGILLTINLFGQNEINHAKPIPYDTIVRYGERKIPVIDLTLGSISATYALPDKPDSMIRLDRKEIQRIVYKDGDIDILNKPVVEMVRNDQWQAVLITRDEKEVQGMFKRGEVSARSSLNSRSKKKAQESATIKIQRKAAIQKASIILITHEEFYGGYGDPPGYYVEGVSYGDKPLEAGTNVVDPKNKDSKTEN